MMQSDHIHVVCHDVPYPVDHGGIYDLFYTIKGLHALGWKITLHCFDYGRGKQSALEAYCSRVHYYQRATKFWIQHITHPYIVGSRMNPKLADALLQDHDPILLEGTHVSWIALDHRFQQRAMAVRTMNVETLYYRHLARNCRSIFKKIYYTVESLLLQRYEGKMAASCSILTLSEQDKNYFEQQFHAKKVTHVPVCIPFENVRSQSGIGYYCIYHGNLSVPENEQAALWLLHEVFNDLKIPLVIAGKHPSKKLEHAAHAQQHTCLVADPDEQQMQDMIEKAQLQLIPSLNQTGVKLKLINALYNGRHCIVNPATVADSAMASLCMIAVDANATKQMIKDFFQVPFTEEMKQLRQESLPGIFDNAKNLDKILTQLYSRYQ